MNKYIFSIALVIVLSLCACTDPSLNDDGGAGADFDAALYYTKTQVYSKTEAYSKTEVDSLVSGIIESRAEVNNPITLVDWAGRAPFTAPAGTVAALIRVYGYNNTATDQTFRIRFTDAETTSYTSEAVIVTVPPGRYFTALGYAPVTAPTMYAWHDYGSAPYASDLTNISLSVNPVLWLLQ